MSSGVDRAHRHSRKIRGVHAGSGGATIRVPGRGRAGGMGVSVSCRARGKRAERTLPYREAMPRACSAPYLPQNTDLCNRHIWRAGAAASGSGNGPPRLDSLPVIHDTVFNLDTTTNAVYRGRKSMTSGWNEQPDEVRRWRRETRRNLIAARLEAGRPQSARHGMPSSSSGCAGCSRSPRGGSSGYAGRSRERSTPAS